MSALAGAGQAPKAGRDAERRRRGGAGGRVASGSCAQRTLAADLALALSLALAGCAAGGTTAPPPTPDPTAVAAAEVPMPVLVEHPPRGAEPPPGWEGRAWRDVLEAARGKTVHWHVEAGDRRLHEWIGDYVADVAMGRYEILVEVVSPASIAEVAAGLVDVPGAAADTASGPVDLIWLPAEHAAALRAADRLYGPWTGFLPSAAYLDHAAPDLARARGALVQGFAMPWGRSQLVLVYDEARDPTPPRSIGELLERAAAEPGTVTYPAPPDRLGSAFVRLACRAMAGESDVDDRLALPATDEALATVAAPCWERLRAAAPTLWREGAAYPASGEELDVLFAAGAVRFSLADDPFAPERAIAEERLPTTTRTAVFEDGTWSAAHFLVIPSAASEPAAAMVLANFLLSPEAQHAKADPANWGDLTVLDPARIDPAWREAMLGIPRGPATLPLATLSAAALAEPHASWFEALDAGWQAEVGGF